ncbi:unnamed protein product [Orchesella dallaii]|uniref:Uncharacterized protein n=1 Tax=Orchesella dallaii TaxID=48710 RepID=A0ABP1Q8C4_9HEXA
MTSSKRFSKLFSGNNDDSEAEPYVDNNFKCISICFCLAIGKFVPYVKGAEGYSRFAHQYDEPLQSSPSACLGLPLCYSTQNPPLNIVSRVTWMKLKREAINLEFIFRICAKHGKYTRESYSTEEEFQHSEMFELNSIIIRKKEYSYEDLTKFGFCEEDSVKISSAVLCILFSFFCIVASFIISFRVGNRTKGDTNRRSIKPAFPESNQYSRDNFDSLFE